MLDISRPTVAKYKDMETGQEIARHEIPASKGNLIKNNDHRRDKSKKIQAMIDNISSKFKNEEKARFFIEEIRKDKPRYIRDQLIILESVVKNLNESHISKALSYCIDNKLYRAVDFRDAANHYPKIIEAEKPQVAVIKGFTQSATDKITSNVHTRSLSEYSKILKGTNGGK